MFLIAKHYIFLTLCRKSDKHILFLISEGILEQISIALCFIISQPELQHALGKGNCRV